MAWTSATWPAGCSARRSRWCARPRYGIAVPAHAEIVLEGVIDPAVRVEEGPFGEFTGYSSDRSTNNLLRVETVMRRRDAWLVDVVGGNSAEHLNLGRIPRESEMVEKKKKKKKKRGGGGGGGGGGGLRERFPGVTAVHYPSSGTHFHAYVALRQSRPRRGAAGHARAARLGPVPEDRGGRGRGRGHHARRGVLLGHRHAPAAAPGRSGGGRPARQRARPSASGVGTTSRMGLDATRGPAFDGIRARIDPAAMARASALLARLDTGKHCDPPPQRPTKPNPPLERRAEAD